MTNWAKVRTMTIAAHMILISATLSAPLHAPIYAQEQNQDSFEDVTIDDDLSFFDYLGSMVEDQGEWMDPLDLADASQLDISQDNDQAIASPPSLSREGDKQ